LANFEKLTLDSTLDFRFEVSNNSSNDSNNNEVDNDKMAGSENSSTLLMHARKYGFRSKIYPLLGNSNKTNVITDLHFKKPKHLHQLFNCLDFFESLPEHVCYSKQFLHHLLNKLAAKYPNHTFESKLKFINYFKKVLNFEKRDPWDVNDKTYFDKPITLREFLNSQLKEKLDKVFGSKDTLESKEFFAMLRQLARKEAAKVFNTVEGIISYVSKAIANNKTKDQVIAAFEDLPIASFKQINSYLAKVEASYQSVSMEQHLRRRIAAKLPALIAYRLLNVFRLFNTNLQGSILIIPTTNLTYCELLPKYIKEAILNEVKSIYGFQMTGIKFVYVKVLDKPSFAKKQQAIKPVKFTKKVSSNSRGLNQKQPSSIALSNICPLLLKQLLDRKIRKTFSNVMKFKYKLKTKLKNYAHNTVVEIPSKAQIKQSVISSLVTTIG
jgi:hypothetical protein